MTHSLRRLIRLHSAKVATMLAMGGAAGIANGGEVIHLLEHVSTPQQNVCQGAGCAVNTQTYAWHQTQWRRWPGTTKLLPNPGRGDQIEPISARPQFNMPAPDTPASAAPALTSGGTRTPVSAPAASRRTAAPTPRATTPDRRGSGTPPDSTTSVTPSPTEPSGPPIDLDQLFQDETTPTPPATPETTEPGDVPPPFDGQGAKRGDPRRTLSALSAGLKASKPPVQLPVTPIDPWQPTSVRKVNDEQSAGEGPVLKEPNLMPDPSDGRHLQVTPVDETSRQRPAAGRPSASRFTVDTDVSQVANWNALDEASHVSSGDKGGNPLRSGSASGNPRRSNPLRRN